MKRSELALVGLMAVGLALGIELASGGVGTNFDPLNTQYDGGGCSGQKTIILEASTGDTALDFGCIVSDVQVYPWSLTSTCSVGVIGRLPGVIQMTQGRGSASSRNGYLKTDTTFVKMPPGVPIKYKTTINAGNGYRAVHLKTASATPETMLVFWSLQERP